MIREICLDHHASLGLHSSKFLSNMITGVSYISLLCHLSFMFDRWTTGGNMSVSNVRALSHFLCPNLQHLTKLQSSLTLAVKLWYLVLMAPLYKVRFLISASYATDIWCSTIFRHNWWIRWWSPHRIHHPPPLGMPRAAMTASSSPAVMACSASRGTGTPSHPLMYLLLHSCHTSWHWHLYRWTSTSHWRLQILPSQTRRHGDSCGISLLSVS